MVFALRWVCKQMIHVQIAPNASYNFYADDCVIYWCSQLIAQAFKFLQSTFDIVQTRVEKQKLLLNVDKSKVMGFFFKSISSPR